MEYARELGLLDTNPVTALKRKAPKVSGVMDLRGVVNPRQARALLDAVCAQAPSGPRLKAFFGVMYFAAARSEEAIKLGEDNIAFPPIMRNEATQEWEIAPDSDGWGGAGVRRSITRRRAGVDG